MPPNRKLDLAALHSAAQDLEAATGDGEQQKNNNGNAGAFPPLIGSVSSEAHNAKNTTAMSNDKNAARLSSFDSAGPLHEHESSNMSSSGGVEINNEKPDPSHEEESWFNIVDLEEGPPAGVKKENEDSTHHSERIRVHSYLRKQSTRLTADDHEREATVDSSRLSRAVRDAGHYALGIVGVEVWLLNNENGWLKRLQGGWWRSDSVRRAARFDETEPEEAYPGVGLAGTLWAEASMAGGRLLHNASRKSFQDLAQQISRDSSLLNLATPDPYNNSIQWRDLQSLMDDPDSAKDSRLGLYLKTGFGLAAGIPFESWVFRGIVIFLARPSTDMKLLSSIENQVYMTSSAEIIGSIITSSDARKACLVRKQEIAAVSRILQESMVEVEDPEEGPPKKNQASSQQEIASPETNQDPTTRNTILDKWHPDFGRRLRTWLNKCKGGNLLIPPSMPLAECFWTWAGCFIGLLILSTINETALKLSDGDYFLLIGPFGALMTLQYGLPSAPASQPRNVILGQAIAGAISMAFTYIPEYILRTWIRRAVGPAFAITAMLKLGIPHPPAGAHSVIYASGDFGWGFYAIVVMSSVVSVLPATLVNNLSEKRQYPTYWGYLPSYVFDLVGKTRNFDGETNKRKVPEDTTRSETRK